MEQVAIGYEEAIAPVLQASVVWGTIAPENDDTAGAKPDRQALQ
jgi:hypothetical protein